MSTPWRFSRERRGSGPIAQRPSFTLVEMLGAIVILGILAGIALGALQKVQEEARRARTVATVNKISRVIMAKYEAYGTRRVPCDVATLANTLYGNNPPKADDIARVRLNALRELMRLEMPDRWSDVTRNPSSPQVNDSSVMLSVMGGYYLKALPDASRRYQAALRTGFVAAGNNQSIVTSNADAKCLYLIVTNDPESAAQFREDEIRRIDTSAMPVFVDGWGNPIHFLRWPAGFVSEPSANLFGDSNIQTRALNLDGSFVNPDPFDPLGVSKRYAVGGEIAGYALYPLVFSAGSDGKPATTATGISYTDGTDINVGHTASQATHTYVLNANQDLDPYAKDGTGYLIGTPLNDANATYTPRHYDNIHNHRIEVR